MGGEYRALPFEELRRVSLSLHKEKRRAHAQGVSDTAVLLAKKYGADETDAARAGILHDITKALSPAQQQKAGRSLEAAGIAVRIRAGEAAPRQDRRGGCRTYFR